MQPVVQQSHFIHTLSPNFPEEVHDIIMQYLGYKNRNGKYMKQLPRKMAIYYSLFTCIPNVIYYWNAVQYQEEWYIRMISRYFNDEFEYCISFDLKYKKSIQGENMEVHCVKTMEIFYSNQDRNRFMYKIRYYFIVTDENGTSQRMEYVPPIRW